MDQGQSLKFEVLDEGGKAISSYDFLKEKIVIGRILSADLRVDDPRTSRIHALVEIRNGEITITDLASTHGTFINGSKVVEGKLKFGDTIQVGTVKIKVSKGSGKPAKSKTSFESGTVHEAEETLVDLDRRIVEASDRRQKNSRRHHNIIPEESRLDERRDGDRRLDQREEDRRKSDEIPPPLPPEPERRKEDRREELGFERRVGERRRNDRRVFDITSLERRIEERRNRRNDDDILPEELEKAFTIPTHARELEVTALWGEHILEVSNYYQPVVLTAGESPRNHYIIPSVGISDEFPLVTLGDDGNAYLAFTPEMQGTVRSRDKIYSLSQLADEKFVKRYADYFVVNLRQEDFAKISIGNVNFFLLYVKPAPRIKPAPIFDKDPLVLRTAIGSSLVFLLLLLAVGFIPKPKPVTIEMIPERFAKLVIRKRPQIPKMAVKGEENKEGGSVMGEGGAPKGPEGQVGKPELPKKEIPQAMQPKSKPKEPPQPQVAKPTPKPQQQRKVVDAKKAKSVGLLKAFSQGAMQKEFKSLLEDGKGVEGAGGFDDFGKAVSGLKGKSLEETGGAGGKGLKGVEIGGAGQTIGIDGPSTKGLGRGGKGTGIGEGISGPGRLGLKGEHSVSIVSENVQVLTGLPKDVINAVVQRHRAEIRACYDAALQRNPGLRGKVVVAFNIQATGVVSMAEVKESSLGDRGLENCIVGRVRSWIFPKPEAPVVTEVTAYPFYLNPAN